MRPLPPACNPTMERCKDRHCRRGAAALLFGLRRPGAVSPRVILAPEDLARPVQPAGFFFAAKPDKGRTGMDGAGDPVEAIEPPVCGGTPMKTPAPSGLHPNQGAAVTQGNPYSALSPRGPPHSFPTRFPNPRPPASLATTHP
jgi:hypothetical protein